MRGRHATEALPEGVRFSLTAPKARGVELVLEGPRVGEGYPMTPVDGGRFTAFVPGLRPGARYRYRVDGGPLRPDPVSRSQPEGPHGPSEVIDPNGFDWKHAARPVALEGAVVYELHVGTFTPEGTFLAAAAELPRLAALGITLVELMPVGDFSGDFGWGYDGVGMFAPYRHYGRPDDLRTLVDTAHGHGLGVVLDVVYNHFGPDGNYVRDFYDAFFSTKATAWGECIDFDGPSSAFTRDFFCANAAYWIREFRMDGLRLDATQDIHDSSKVHIVGDIVRAAREAAGGRAIVVLAENEPQDPRFVRAIDEGGLGCDALWNDDFQHAAHAAATGRHEAYFGDTRGTAQELVSAVKWGFLFQGQYYHWKKGPRGGPALDLSASRFVTYLQNHDQVANSTSGRRLHALTSPGRHRALRLLHLLAPGTPMLFQGEEYDAPQPFLYFADHEEELAGKVAAGRHEFLTLFPSARDPRVRGVIARPGDRGTFLRCKLDPRDRAGEPRIGALELTRDLLALRRADPVFAAQASARIHGAVLGDEAFVLRFFGEDRFDDRLVIVNLGRDLDRMPTSEPLLAPSPLGRWELVISSEDPRYGGGGTPPFDGDGEAVPVVAGHSAIVLAPHARPRRG